MTPEEANIFPALHFPESNFYSEVGWSSKKTYNTGCARDYSSLSEKFTLLMLVL